MSTADVIAQAERERAAQGFPPQVEDPEVLAKIADLILGKRRAR